MLEYFLKAHLPSPRTCIDNRMFSNESISLLHYYLLLKNVDLEYLID